MIILVLGVLGRILCGSTFPLFSLPMLVYNRKYVIVCGFGDFTGLCLCSCARGSFSGLFCLSEFSSLGPFFFFPFALVKWFKWCEGQCNTRFEKAFGSKDRIFRVNLQDLMIIYLFASLFLSPHHITPIFPYPIQVWGVFLKTVKNHSS